jgi:methylthioribose-1-phosphate isomerase
MVTSPNGEAVGMDALAEIQSLEAEAEAIVAQARAEVKELLERAKQEVKESRTTACALTLRAARARIHELLVTTGRQDQALSARASSEVSLPEVEVRSQLPEIMDEIVSQQLSD